MLSIKLGSARSSNNKPCIVEIPSVVEKPVVRNVAFDLRNRVKQDPNLGLSLTKEKFEALLESLPGTKADDFKARLSTLASSNIITAEELIEPKTYIDTVTNFLVAGLTLNAESGKYVVADTGIFNLAANITLTASNTTPIFSGSSYVHRNFKKVVLPITWTIIGSSASEAIDNTLLSTNSGVPTAVDSTVVTKVESATKDGAATYKFTCAAPSAALTFKVKAVLDMSKAELYEETNSVSSSSESDAVVASWKAERVFEISVPTTIS